MKRPPRLWFYRMIRRVKKQYPSFGIKRIAKVVGGIWHKRYGERTKEKLVKAEGGNPSRKISKLAVLKSIKSRKTPARLRKGLIKFARKRGWL